MYKTILLALYAAFTLVSCDAFAQPLEGGGVMLIGARTAAWSGGTKKPTARDYVQDGIYILWDGIENAGWGLHEDGDNKSVKNLVGEDPIFRSPGNTGFRFEGNYISRENTSVTFGNEQYISNLLKSGNFTLSVVGYCTHNEKNGWKRLFSVATAMKLHTWTLNTGFLVYEGIDNRVIHEITNPKIDIPSSYTFRCSDGHMTLFVNGIKELEYDIGERGWGYAEFWGTGAFSYGSRIGSIKIYAKPQEDYEVLKNYEIDKARFGLT